MSKNISADLLRFNGEIGPQYLDQDDLTSGPDGTMKPITREVLREMIVANFPDLQRVEVDNPTELPNDYPDSAVKTELEAIKQRQTETLQRLDGVFDTKQIGSNVELIKEIYDINLSGVTHFGENQSSSAVNVIPIDATDYKNVGIFIKNHSNLSVTINRLYIWSFPFNGNHDFNENVIIVNTEVTEIGGNGVLFLSVSDKVDSLYTPYISIRLTPSGGSARVSVQFLGGRF